MKRCGACLWNHLWVSLHGHPERVDWGVARERPEFRSEGRSECRSEVGAQGSDFKTKIGETGAKMFARKPVSRVTSQPAAPILCKNEP